MGKNKGSVVARGGGKGRWCRKAVRNKAKFDKREKEKHRTVIGITNGNQSERVLHV